MDKYCQRYGSHYVVKAGAAYRFGINKFDESDGLQGREFNAYSAFKKRNGDLMFGGAHGFNIFNPTAISITKSKPRLLFTDFQLFNKSVTVGDTISGNVVLKTHAKIVFVVVQH